MPPPTQPGGCAERGIAQLEPVAARNTREELMQSTRRALLIGGMATSAVLLAPRFVRAQTPAGPFKLDPLPYANNALEPHIDAQTMEIHHDRHHAAYVNNLNNAAKDHAVLGSTPLHDLLAKLQDVPEAVRTVVRNNGGGHANHT